MTYVVPMRHLETFARLRPAGADDNADLWRLERTLVGTAGAFDWEQARQRAEVTIVVAREGDSLVGAMAVSHAPDAATASLLRLAVFPSARSRGVGRLLLDAAISAAIEADAALLVADIPADDARLARLLLILGFERLRSGPRSVRYRRQLRRGSSAQSVIRLGAAR